MIKIKYKIFSIFVALIVVNTFSNAKYVIEEQFEIANLNIDRTKPQIEFINTHNTSSGGNNTKTIGVTVKFTDKNLEKVVCDNEHIKIKSNGNYINVDEMKFILINELQGEKVYQIQFKNAGNNENLQIEFLEGIAVDKANLMNDVVGFEIKL